MEVKEIQEAERLDSHIGNRLQGAEYTKEGESEAIIDAMLRAGREVTPEASFQHNLEARLHQSYPDRGHRSRPRYQRRQLIAVIGISVLTLIIVTLTVPPLRVLAQQALQFFVPSSNDRRSTNNTSPNHLAPEEIRPTLTEVEARLNFEVKVPTLLPNFFHLESIREDTRRKNLVLSYTNPRGRILAIEQRYASDDIVSLFGPPEFVEEVQIGETLGEFVIGVWINSNRLTIYELDPIELEEFTWDATINTRRLRWRLDDNVYVISAGGGSPGHPGYLNKQDLITIAKSMRPLSGIQDQSIEPQVFTPVGESQEQENRFPLSTREVIGTADFQVKIPTLLPTNYALIGGRYSELDSTVTLAYQCGTDWGFFLVQQPMSEEEFAEEQILRQERVGASALIQRVTIWGDSIGEYVQGTWRHEGFLQAGTPPPKERVWDSNLNYHSLIWYAKGILFRVFTSRGYIGGPYSGPCTIDLKSLLMMVESMK